MEDSLNSSINRAFSSKQTVVDHHDCHDDEEEEEEEEESGWTTYFEDLDISNKNIEQQEQHSTYSCSSFSSPSLISDAGSRVAWKVADFACPSPNKFKKLNVKRSRAKEISHLDDSLEDTASSPNNSPKVSFFNQIDMKNHMKTDDNMFSSLGKGNNYDHHQDSKLQTNEGNEMKNYEFQDLKKRGLCLFPVSMLMNYHG